MSRADFEFVPNGDDEILRIAARGREVLANPLTNIGMAFTLEERDKLELNGLLPPGVASLEQQIRRISVQYDSEPDDLAKYQFLSGLHNRNEVLYFKLIVDNLEAMLPIVYTPTISVAIQAYSHWYHRPRGVFLSIDDPDSIEEALRCYGHRSDEIDLIVATDSEGILGIGDQGVGGIQIAVGKLAVYTAAAGIHPHRVLPVVLDVGTDNLDLLAQDGYLGLRHSRVRGKRYDEFIDRFVKAVQKTFPKAMLHWEDFGASNAHRILTRYQKEICTFNDDIQGTAAVVVSAALAAIRATESELEEQRIVVFGAGSAGIGIANLLSDIMMESGMTKDEARSRFWGISSRGLLREGIKMRDFQAPFARRESELVGWQQEHPGEYGLLDVIRNVRPTILIGTSAQSGAFNEKLVREMARYTERPIIMPLSNPTSLAEAFPEDVLRWTDGKALIATGSPFQPVIYNDVEYRIAQANNALVFPGLGLGVTVCRASRVTDGMLAAAAKAVASLVNVRTQGASILPAMSQVRSVSAQVGLEVAKAAKRDGVAEVELDDPVQAIFEAMWQPRYPKIEIIEREELSWFKEEPKAKK